LFTNYYKIDINNIDATIIKKCSDIIKQGNLVAFPTETVYGLGANALDANAIKKIFIAKGRPMDNPLILHISSFDMLIKYVSHVPNIAYDLSKVFWPGPLTMIFKKSDLVPYEATSNLDTVAIRMPSHPVALELIKQCNLPIAAPSANSSGKPSPTNARHVYDDLNGKISAIIDCGKSDIGIESTVLDLTTSTPTILRPGGTSLEQLEMLIPNLISEKIVKKENTPKAPGMKYKHYSPKAPLYIVKGTNENVKNKINTLADENTGILCSLETLKNYSKGKILCLGSIHSPDELAYNLFESLRMFDKLNVEKIYCEFFNYGPFKDAIINRLKKAANNKIINT